MNSYLIIIIICIVVLLSIEIFIKINRKRNAKKITTKNYGEVKLENNVKPLFSSSFIQYWFAQNWEYDRWIDELNMLKNIGINEIILQTIADTRNKYTVYPTKISGYTSNDIDMVELVLSAADSLGMKVRIGLGFNNLWWIMNAFSYRWLNSEAETNKLIIREITKMYGIHESLNGWYIPYEYYQLTALTTSQQCNLNNFIKQITFEIKINSDKDIMIAPFYYGRFSFIRSLSTWSKLNYAILKDSGIDIVAMQDSIGACFNKMTLLDELYSSMKITTDNLGIKLFADTETFDIKSHKYLSGSQDRILQQLTIEKKYVEGFVAFSIDHYQNINIQGQECNYKEYYNYYQANK